MAGLLSPPGPRGHFFRGNLPDFQLHRLEYLASCARNYGDVVGLRFGPRRIFLVSHPNLIEEVLVTQSRHFSKHFALRLNPLVLGKGLLTSEGDFWLRQRRLVQPAFQRKRMQGYGAAMVAATERLLDQWSPGETRDLVNEMMCLTLDITAKTLFDADVSRDAQDVGNALRVLQENFLRRFSNLIAPPLFLPTPENLRLKRAVRRLDNIIYGFIRQRRESGIDRGDFLSLLLQAQDEDDGSRMTDQQVRDEAMTLFLAGHETTALTLSWAWYLLAQHPHTEDSLVDEIQRVLGKREPTVEDLPRLVFTEYVALEALRLYPPAYLIGREALQEVSLGGYRVPRGTTILMSQWVVQRDARYFEDPEEFRPERWANGFAERLPAYAYFPFGGGPRVCIGNKFAMMEAILVLAGITRRFRFRLVPGQTITPRPTFTLRPYPGIQALIQHR